MQADSLLWVTNHPSQHEVHYWISYIEALFDSIIGRNVLEMCASKRVKSTDNTKTLNFSILQVLKAALWLKRCLPSYLNVQSGKLNGSMVTP